MFSLDLVYIIGVVDALVYLLLMLGSTVSNTGSWIIELLAVELDLSLGVCLTTPKDIGDWPVIFLFELVLSGATVASFCCGFDRLVFTLFYLVGKMI
jgi:hypothetical protein